MIQRSNKTPLESVDVMDDIARKCIQPQSSFLQIQLTTLRRFLTASSQEQVVTVMPKNLMGRKNSVNHTDYDCFHSSIQRRESCDKCSGDINVTDSDTDLRLLKNNSENRLSDYDKRTIYHNSSCLHSKQMPSMSVLWRLSQRTKFNQNCSMFQQSSL